MLAQSIGRGANGAFAMRQQARVQLSQTAPSIERGQHR